MKQTTIVLFGIMNGLITVIINCRFNFNYITLSGTIVTLFKRFSEIQLLKSIKCVKTEFVII